MNESIRKIAEKIKDIYNGTLSFNEEMKAHTTMKVGGAADIFAEPKDSASLALLVGECKKAGVPFYTLGGGSNVIVSDEGFRGVIISTNSLISIEEKDGLLVCGAGVKTSRVVDVFSENGARGMEKFAGLPGTCGGACYMNARCYSCDICSVIDYVEYFDTGKTTESAENTDKAIEKQVKVYHNDTSIPWGYKKSPFMDMECIITKVAFKMGGKDKSRINEIKSECHTYIQDRIKKGHFKAPSAGSVFKNNRDFGAPCGKIIDDAGLKGVSVGGAQVAPWHGNIIINNGNATCRDIKELTELVKERIKEKDGFCLECEVLFI